MIQAKQITSRPSLEEILKRFESWRKTRRSRTPIPEDLWQAAISLCENNSIYEISKALHLSYTKLKERVAASKAFALSESPSHPGFVELDFGQAVIPLEYVVEMEEKNGAKMRVQIKGENGFDLLELIKAFWARGS